MKMKIKTIKTIFSKTLLLFFVLIFIIPQTAGAQFSQMLSSGGGNGNLSGSLNVQGIGGILLSCTGLDSKIKGMLGSLTNSLKNKKKSTKSAADVGQGTGTETPAEPSSTAASAVPIIADATDAAVGAVKASAAKKVDDTAETLEEENKAQQCLKDIAYYGAKKLLEKFTTQTVNWIQGGFKGQPLYLRDPQSFFKGIANEEWNKITNTIAFDKKNYPFGRDTMIALLSAELSTFEKNAQFTLNRAVPTGDATDFYRDIRVGGWNALLTQALIPQNNPVGFLQMTQNEIDRKTEGGNVNDIMSIKEELKQSGGFLSQKICAISEHQSGEYIDPTKENDGIFTEEDWKDIRDNKNGNRTTEERDDAKKRICKTWETTTPGQTIANVLTTTTTTNIRQAELIKDVNQSLAAIFDAAIAKLAEMGLKALEGSTDDNTGTTINGGGPGQNIVGGSLQDTLDGIINADDSNTNPTSLGSNLYENLPYLIYLQKRYAGVHTDLPPAPQYQDSEDNWVDYTGFDDPAPGYYGLPVNNARLYDLVVSLQTLDYCIPGPHYGWEAELDVKFDNYLADKLSSGTFEIKDKAQQFSQLLDPSGMMSGQIDKWVAQGQKAVTNGYLEMYRQYKAEIKRRWPDDLSMSPGITPDANKELNRLQTYIDQIEINKVRIAETTRILTRLKALKVKIDAVTLSINTTQAAINMLPPGTQDQALTSQLDGYNAELEKNKRSFYRLAPSLIGKADFLDAKDDMDGYLDIVENIDELVSLCQVETSDGAMYSIDGTKPLYSNRRDTWTILGTVLQEQWNNSFTIGGSFDFSDYNFEGDWLANLFSGGLQGYYPQMGEFESKMEMY